MDTVRIEQSLDSPTELFSTAQHAIYWLGISEPTAFRCNTYLLKDGAGAIRLAGGRARAKTAQTCAVIARAIR